MKQTLKEFLQAKAVELKSDWNDVPEWVITACEEYLDQSKPSAKEAAIDSAEYYLSDSDELTTEEQIEAIAAHENPEDYIDNVEGVVVWEKLEYQFTCSKFLSMIGWPE